MACEASGAAAEFALGAFAVATAHGRARVIGVKDSDVVVAFGGQLTATKKEHPAADKDSAVPFSCEPGDHV